MAMTLMNPKIPSFYSPSPELLIALVRVFDLQSKDLLTDRHAYYEFGLFQGFSFWFAEQVSREFTSRNFRFFGFDSFAGLPASRLEKEAAVFRKGDYRSSLEMVIHNLTKYKADLARMNLHSGFFSPAMFERLRREYTFPPVSICLIDVDLYESTVPVLDFIYPYLVPSSILIMDDYNQFGPDDDNTGERRALREFERRNPGFRTEHLFDYGREGAVFRVLSV